MAPVTTMQSWCHGSARVLLCLWCSWAWPAWLMAAPVDISTQEHDRALELHMRVVLDAPHDVVWSTITDYENVADWVPGMSSSEILERRPDGATVAQSGRAQVLFFGISVDVVVTVHEMPPDRIRVRLLRGDLRRLEGEYRLTPVDGPGGVRLQLLEWQGRVEPASRLPGFLTRPVMRENLRRQFEGLVSEIERRARLARGPG
ncbi:MAG: SRPBCC family protein [Hydrogenophaga sp.]|nr:SRPBCC family protein [Hydrogenophaga sp.]